MTDLPVRVHPRVVLTPSSVERSQTLPQYVVQPDAGQQFYVEFWVEAPSGGTTGVRSGQLDLYFDPAVASLNPTTIYHGSVFDSTTDDSYHAVKDAAFVRSFTGTTDNGTDYQGLSGTLNQS